MTRRRTSVVALVSWLVSFAACRPAPDGTWKVARDMDNSNRPAAQVTRGSR